MSQFRYKFTLPPPGATDVASRELSIQVAGQDAPQVVVLPGDALQTDFIGPFDMGAALKVSLVDIDSATPTPNRSVPSDAFEFTVIDDVAPPKPGMIGVAESQQV